MIGIEQRMGRDVETALEAPAAVSVLVDWGAARLAGACDDPRFEAETLLCAVLTASRAGLYAHPGRLVDAGQEQRRAGVPEAYIRGQRGFHSIVVGVSQAVLVPRPETELLVDAVLSRTARNAAFSVLDLGTGSGCVALAIKHARLEASVTAIDLSDAALELAKANGRHLALEVRWLKSDWFDRVANECFDFIVCNPPYVASADPHMEALRHEPRLALDGGADGLDAVRRVLSAAASHLGPHGLLIMEHGFDQAASIAAMAARNGLGVLALERDLGGLPRVSIIGLRA
jgi:release factor glutamine methyltransferase